VSERLEAQLRQFLARETGEPVHAITGLQRTPSGLSRETWLFDAHFGGSTAARVEQLVLRRDPERGGGLLDTDRLGELRLLQALEHSDLPTPVVRYADIAGSHLERPSLVLRREPGVCDYLVLNGDRELSRRLKLAQRFCELLAQLHLSDWRQLGLGELLDDPGPAAALSALDQWTATLLERGPGAYPELTAVELWLRQRAPTSQATVLVHGDFKPGNALVDGDEVVVLLDWETAHLGDPLEDLGWVTQPLRLPEHLIAEVWEQEHLIERYQALTGFTVDAEALAWWQAFASYKTAVIQLTGLAGYIGGAADRLFREPAQAIRVLLRLLETDRLVAG
jgi:aminoglycoside phosphotransferase (APT) family kinase protein